MLSVNDSLKNQQLQQNHQIDDIIQYRGLTAALN